MTRIAILGASSHLARDLILSFAHRPTADLVLFARQPEALAAWAAGEGIGGRFPVLEYAAFATMSCDAILNFVGAGDPARLARMGSDILDVTWKFDELALAHLRRQPSCRYLFLSSGAVYGGAFTGPADAATPACLAVNAPPYDHYAFAKLYAECRHRAMAAHAIIDLRVFSYFSATLDPAARFFVADILRAIRERRCLAVSRRPMVRDFLHPADLRALVDCLLAAPPDNAAVDCYSLAPIDKLTLLEAMRLAFGLDYEMVDPAGTDSPATSREQYYSVYRKAVEYGYRPEYTSLRCVLEEAGKAGASPQTPPGDSRPLDPSDIPS